MISHPAPPGPASPWVFRYQEEGRPAGTFLRRALLRPTVIVRFAGTHVGSHRVLALVDSGADHVLAAPWIARDIGVEPDPGVMYEARSEASSHWESAARLGPCSSPM